MVAKLANTSIEAAISGFEAQKKSSDAQIAELRAMLSGTGEGSAGEIPARQRRRKFSAAARKRMQEAPARPAGEQSPRPWKGEWADKKAAWDVIDSLQFHVDH